MPVVTISRQFGAGANTLGQMVAGKLNYTLLDNELIQLVAEKAKVSPHWVESVEKEAGGKLQKFVSSLVSKGLVDKVLDGQHGYIDEKIYVDLLHDIINKIATEDNAVIIGRGGQYILADRKNVLHVLLVAEKTDRVKFMQTHYGMDNRTALQAINLDDRRRVNLYHKFHKTDYDQPGHYHLVLNTSRLELKRASEIIINLIQRG
jgi:cytidylate kinase